MATTPDREEAQPTRAQRVTRAVATPLLDRSARVVTLLALVSAVVVLAPIPFGSIAAAAIAVISWEQGRRR